MIMLNFKLPELKNCNQAAIVRAVMVTDNTAQSIEHFFPHGNVASINYRLCGSTLYHYDWAFYNHWNIY